MRWLDNLTRYFAPQFGIGQSITAHAFSHVNSSRSRQKIKQFQRILTFYAKVKKNTTQDKKATTQPKKDFWGSKGTKRGHSGQKGRRGPCLALCYSLSSRGVSREHARPKSASEKTPCFSTFWPQFFGLQHLFLRFRRWPGPEADFWVFGPVFGLIFVVLW